jgi:hypothetical protein
MVDIYLNDPWNLPVYYVNSLILPERNVDRGTVGRLIQGKDKPTFREFPGNGGMILCQFEIENELSILPVSLGANRTHIPSRPEQCVLKK